MNDGAFCHYCQQSPCECPGGDHLAGARLRRDRQQNAGTAKLAIWDEMRTTIRELLTGVADDHLHGGPNRIADARDVLRRCNEIAKESE